MTKNTNEISALRSTPSGISIATLSMDGSLSLTELRRPRALSPRRLRALERLGQRLRQPSLQTHAEGAFFALLFAGYLLLLALFVTQIGGGR